MPSMTISMTMTTSQLTETVNPLTELPAVGGVVSVVHSLLTDFGIPLWIAESLELMGLLLATYLVLRQLLSRALPWFATVAEPAVDWLSERLAMVLLVPELAVTRVLARAGRPPFAMTYTYGEGVVTVVGVAASVVRVILQVPQWLRRVSRVVAVVLTALLALSWNSGTCLSPGPSQGCVSPATHWLAQADHWFTEQNR